MWSFPGSTVRFLGVLTIPILVVGIAAGSGPTSWTAADPDYRWSFPADHWSHDRYRLEWWYFTGHLAAVGPTEREFGFQFTVFRIGLHPHPLDYESSWTASNLFMGHAAVTDKTAGRHVFSELLYREASFLSGFGEWPDRRIAWSRAPVGTDGIWTIDWNGTGFDFEAMDERQGFAFDLSTRPSKKLVLQGPGGYSRKAETDGAASLYYSMTRLATEGTLRIDGSTYRVSGESWMDKEFSTSHLGDEQVGWDWFSLQLEDGRDLMLYVLRREDGSVDYSRGTVVGPDGRTRFLDAGEWSYEATSSWRSRRTGAVYPARWTIQIPDEGLRVEVEPVVADQENVGHLSGGVHYWEGAVAVRDARGRPVGRGYVELTGYGEGSRPPV
jgi:predicted secreted hydrolase